MTNTFAMPSFRRPSAGLLVAAAAWVVLGLPNGLLANTDSEDTSGQRGVRDLCNAVSGRLASVRFQECLKTELEPTGARSVQGWPIVVREFSASTSATPAWLRELLDLPPAPAPGRVLLVGGMHGDELSATTIVFKWIQELEQTHVSEPPAPFDEFDALPIHWRIAPLLNPDGLLQRPAVRMNANGVDLNRNFPTSDWFAESKDYWERRTGKDPRRYPGPYPVSEPESRWLADEIDRFQPDVVVSIHAPYNNVDFDGPPAAPDRLGPLHLRLMGTYPGSLGRFAGISRQIPVVTIELPHAGIMPSEEDQQGILEDLVSYLGQKITTQREGRGSSTARESSDEH